MATGSRAALFARQLELGSSSGLPPTLATFHPSYLSYLRSYPADRCPSSYAPWQPGEEIVQAEMEIREQTPIPAKRVDIPDFDAPIEEPDDSECIGHTISHPMNTVTSSTPSTAFSLSQPELLGCVSSSAMQAFTILMNHLVNPLNAPYIRDNTVPTLAPISPQEIAPPKEVHTITPQVQESTTTRRKHIEFHVGDLRRSTRIRAQGSAQSMLAKAQDRAQHRGTTTTTVTLLRSFPYTRLTEAEVSDLFRAYNKK